MVVQRYEWQCACAHVRRQMHEAVARTLANECHCLRWFRCSGLVRENNKRGRLGGRLANAIEHSVARLAQRLACNDRARHRLAVRRKPIDCRTCFIDEGGRRQPIRRQIHKASSTSNSIACGSACLVRSSGGIKRAIRGREADAHHWRRFLAWDRLTRLELPLPFAIVQRERTTDGACYTTGEADLIEHCDHRCVNTTNSTTNECCTARTWGRVRTTRNLSSLGWRHGPGIDHELYQ